MHVESSIPVIIFVFGFVRVMQCYTNFNGNWFFLGFKRVRDMSQYVILFKFEG